MEIHKAEFLFSQTILGKAKIKNPNVLERTYINKKSTNYGKESSNKSRRCVLCQNR